MSIFKSMLIVSIKLGHEVASIMNKKNIETLLFYLMFTKAINAILKYTHNLNLEHLIILNEIINYHQVQHQGIYMEDLIKKVDLSKRNVRYHLEQLYHLKWIIKLRDEVDQRRILILPITRYQEKLHMLFCEVEELLKVRYLNKYEEFKILVELPYITILYQALNQVKLVGDRFDLTLDEIFLLGKLTTHQEVSSLKAFHSFSHHDLICINSIINGLYQKGYIIKYRKPEDERMVYIKLLDSQLNKTERLFVECYNEFQAEMKSIFIT